MLTAPWCYSPDYVMLLGKNDFKKKIIFVFRDGEGREKEGEGNISVREEHLLVAFYTYPDLGLNLQTRHVL